MHIQQTDFKPQDRSRFNNFDFLRFMLASLVVFTHSYSIQAPSMAMEPFYRLTRMQIAGGTIAVDWFFVISGFLITNSWIHSRGLIDYLKKRVLRIYPGFVAVVLLAVFVAGPLGTSNPFAYFHRSETYSFIFRQLFFHKDPILYGTFSLSHTPGLPLGSLATLRFEIGCYLLLASLGLTGLLRSKATILTIFIGSLFFYNVYLWMAWHPSIHYFGNLDYLPRLVTYFMAGVLFYKYREQIPHSRALLAMVLVVLCLSCRSGGLSIVFPICGTYLLFYLAFSRSLKLQNFGRYGDFSYGIFLYGYPVQQILAQHWNRSLAVTTLFFVAMPITCALAVASWYWIEKPFLKLKPRAAVAPPVVIADDLQVTLARTKA